MLSRHKNKTNILKYFHSKLTIYTIGLVFIPIPIS